ncbi:MAG: type II secretion system F family protein [Candidatus Bathyarchaeota archaeon]|nr:type II secretion system F family protein [Candidatus Bathyarchaeota archaeon]
MFFKKKMERKEIARLIIIGIPATVGILIALFGYYIFFPKLLFHILLVVGVIVALSVPALLIHFDEARKKKIDFMLPQFLRDVYEGQESGLTFLKALQASAARDYGPLTKELRQMVVQLSWGVEFEEAFTSFANRVDTEITKKTVALLLETTRLGGDIKASLSSVASFVTEMNNLREERESELKPYMTIIYISSIIFMIIMIIIYQSFFTSMASTAAGGFLKLPLSIEDFKAALFDLVIIVSFFGGITSGKLSQGKILSGLKHSISLIVIVTVFFGVLLLDPIPPTISQVDITPKTPISTYHVLVSAVVDDPYPASGVKSALVVWTMNNWLSNRTVEMNYNLPKERWEAQIPPLPVDAKVFFFIKAYDNSENLAINDNNKSYYSFTVSK